VAAAVRTGGSTGRSGTGGTGTSRTGGNVGARPGGSGGGACRRHGGSGAGGSGGSRRRRHHAPAAPRGQRPAHRRDDGTRRLNPPGGLAVDQVPQFIVLGFDDNRYVDGMNWVLDTLEGKTNAAGKGNARTHDGQKLIVSFYFTTDSLDAGGEALLATWRRAAGAGHEVANHNPHPPGAGEPGRALELGPGDPEEQPDTCRTSWA
jgi:hypothetical protein